MEEKEKEKSSYLAMCPAISQRAELLFAKTRLFKDFAKGSCRKRSGMHRHVRLPAIWVTQHLMAASLSYFYESGTNEFCEDLTGGVRHRGLQPERSKSSFQQESLRRGPASRRSMPGLALGQRQESLRCLDHEWSSLGMGYERSNSPEIPVHLWAQVARSIA